GPSGPARGRGAGRRPPAPADPCVVLLDVSGPGILLVRVDGPGRARGWPDTVRYPFAWRRAAGPGTVGARVGFVTACVLCRCHAAFSFEVPPCHRLLPRTGICCLAFSPCRWTLSAATP